MSPNTPDPQPTQPQQPVQPSQPAAPAEPPPPLPEVQRELEKLWDAKLKLRAGKVTKDSRKLIGILLGNETAEKIPKRPEAHVVSSIYRQIATARKAFGPYIVEKHPEAIKLKYFPKGSTSETAVTLKDLVGDPTSPEAQAVAWLFQNAVSTGNRKNISKVFYKVDKKEDVSDAQTLKKMRELLNRLADDDENYELGNEGTTIAGTPPQATDGLHRLGKYQNIALAAEHQVGVELGKPKGNPGPFQDRVLKAEEEVAKLRKKKRVLRKELDSLNKLSQTLSAGNKPPSIAGDLDALTENFSPTLVAGKFTSNVAVDGIPKTLETWLGDDDLPSTADSLLERYRQTETNAPPASLVLTKLMKAHFGPNLYGLSDDDQKRFYKEMREMLLSRDTTSSNAPSSTHAEAHTTTQHPGPSGTSHAHGSHAAQSSGSHAEYYAPGQGLWAWLFRKRQVSQSASPDVFKQAWDWLFARRGGSGSGGGH